MADRTSLTCTAAGFIALRMLARSTLNQTETWYAVADTFRTLVH